MKTDRCLFVKLKLIKDLSGSLEIRWSRVSAECLKHEIMFRKGFAFELKMVDKLKCSF